ncbi:uncharacterized protein LOC127240011 [Andrographis paniculata]|uniref:uncharacterized protein LOC127240011 n=1 Tax=Andrographis paniculata TaxID=175694 RepID=UPI0021E72D4E|nr:uncharacterized protein LOC127240011 [Andrographis paniculata]
MNQPDHTKLVSASSDGAGDEESPVNSDLAAATAAVEDLEADFPPESFWLSKDAEFDWFDRNAFIYERKDSTKGGNNNNSSLNPSSNSNSQRFSVSLKSKASIIGLPKSQKATLMDSKRRTCKPASIRLFPNRSDSVGKSSVPVAEPGSPKVSCIGRVRSKRCRRRSASLKRKEKLIEKSRSNGGGGGGGGEKQKAGFYSKVMSIFRKKKGHRKASRSASRKVVEEEQVVVDLRRRSVSVKVREIQMSGEPAGLGEVKRFKSGRRSDSWTADDFGQAVSGLRVA